MIEPVEPQSEPGAPQRAASGPPDHPGPGEIAGGRPDSTASLLNSAAHPRGLCGDRDCERCRAIRAKAVAARSTKPAPPPWPLPGPIGSLEDVLTLCDWATRHLDAPRANAIARLCTLWLKAHDFATRLRALEARGAKLSTEGK